MARNIVGRCLLDSAEGTLQRHSPWPAPSTTLKHCSETVFRTIPTRLPSGLYWLDTRARGVAIGFVHRVMGRSPAAEPDSPNPCSACSSPRHHNPTTGWYAVVPETFRARIDFSVEELFRTIISAGIVSR